VRSRKSTFEKVFLNAELDLPEDPILRCPDFSSLTFVYHVFALHKAHQSFGVTAGLEKNGAAFSGFLNPLALIQVIGALEVGTQARHKMGHPPPWAAWPGYFPR
jgi:hypothetical protein